MGFLSSFVAPLTLVTALLFYFGYVSTREFFRYFGVDVDIIGLSSQEFVMRSPGALFIPVMVLAAARGGLIVGHRALRRRLVAAAADDPAPCDRSHRVDGDRVRARRPRTRPSSCRSSATGLRRAAAHAAVPRDRRRARRLRRLDRSRARRREREPRGVVVLLVLVMVAGTFWCTATIAQWWGLGQARALAADLETLPAVVLDTTGAALPRQRRHHVPAARRRGIHDRSRRRAAGAPTYGYRYFGLRLLAQGGGRLYLVPDAWSADASTIVVPYDDVRVRFRFVPDADPPTA